MTRTFLRIPFSSTQLVRIYLRPTSQNGGYFRASSSQHLIRSYWSSGIFQQNEDSTQEVTGNLSELAEDRSAQVETTTTEDEEEAANQEQSTRGTWRIDLPSVPRAGHTNWNERFSTEFDAWIVNKLKHNSNNRFRHFFNVTTDDISIKQLCSKRGSIAVNVAFRDRPVANAFTIPLLERLTKVFNKIASTESINGVCLTSGDAAIPDPNFCSGAHVQTLASLGQPDWAESFIRKISNLCTAIRDTPVPVVALISGACVGAGLEVAASCDIRVATRDAKFSMPEVLLNIPSVVQARLLCEIIGWGRARHLMLTGYTWTAQEAYEAGLVTKLFDNREHMMNWAATYMKQVNGDDIVYRKQKKLMKDWEDQSIDEGIEAGVQCFADSFANERRSKNIQAAIERAIAKRKRTKSRPSDLEGSSNEDNTDVAETKWTMKHKTRTISKPPKSSRDDSHAVTD